MYLIRALHCALSVSQTDQGRYHTTSLDGKLFWKSKLFDYETFLRLSTPEHTRCVIILTVRLIMDISLGACCAMGSSPTVLRLGGTSVPNVYPRTTTICPRRRWETSNRWQTHTTSGWRRPGLALNAVRPQAKCQISRVSVRLVAHEAPAQVAAVGLALPYSATLTLKKHCPRSG